MCLVWITFSFGKTYAASVFPPTGGALRMGTPIATGSDNTGDWKGTLGNDSNYWITARSNPGGLNKIIYIDGVALMGANKLLLTIDDSNTTTADAFTHQICDWSDSTGVDAVADTDCTTGGWRTLQPRRVDYTSTADVTRTYEIYDGYFSTRTSVPGTVVSTPLTNFIDASQNNRVMIRVYSTVASTTLHKLDWVQLEVAIDPNYEVGGYNIAAGSTPTGYISDLVGAVSTNLNASDNNSLTIPMPSAGNAADIQFTFNGVETYPGMNTILVSPEIKVSNVALTYSVYIRNYSNSTWTQLGGTNFTVTAADVEYVYAFNDTAIPGFSLSDYISASGNVSIRFLTNAPASKYTISFDRIYMMMGSVNADTSKCEISWGTGTATDCYNTTTVKEGKTVAPSVSTWQAGSTLEYPSSYYSLDNDDDANNGEYAASQNISFPIRTTGLGHMISVTGILYAAKYRSNISTETVDPQIRDYYGLSGTSGWVSTPATDTNASATVYGWTDSWVNAEITTSPEDSIDTGNNLMNMRLRTSASTNVTATNNRSWAFAMMSIRWVEEPNKVTVRRGFQPTNGILRTGSEVATDNTNTGSWKALLGADTNYWISARSNPGGLNKLIYVDGIDTQYQNTYDIPQGINKLLISITDSDITTGDAYTHQICDWQDPTGVDAPADSDCTGGGWRTLQPRKVDYVNTTVTARLYEVYDGYFSTRTSVPGTVVRTPLINFVIGGSLLLRVYSTVASTTQHRLDNVQVEVGVDPIYEVGDMTIAAGSTPTGYISDLVGGVSTGVNGSDNNRLTIPMPASSQPVDVQFTFNNVKTYPGMNTFVVIPEMNVSNVALTYGVYLRNYTTSSWTQLSTNFTGTTADVEYAYAFNGTTIGGFNISDYISPQGDVTVRFLTNGPGTKYNLVFDRIYMIAGSTNTNTAQCEISWGTGTTTDCSNTRDTKEGKTVNPTTSTWQRTAVVEYPATFYALDNDDDTVNGEYAVSSNLSFPMNVASNGSITAMHYAIKYHSNNTAMTQDVQLRDFSGVQGTSGWANTPGTDTNATAAYAWFDTWILARPQTTPAVYVDTIDGISNMRVRTSISTLTSAPNVSDIDFALMSMRYLRYNAQLNVTTSGSQVATINVPSTNTYIGAPFIYTLDQGSAYVTRIKLTDTGTVVAGSGLANVNIYYDQDSPCNYNGNETLFNSTPGTFGDPGYLGTEKTTLTGNMPVNSSPTCVYTVLDITNNTANNETIKLSDMNSTTDILLDYGHAQPAASVELAGTTTLVKANQAPNAPTTLIQETTTNSVISTGSWNNTTSMKFTASGSDPDNPDTLYLCIEAQPLGTPFTNVETSCNAVGTASAGSGVSLDQTLSGLTDATEYHWQARTKDSGGLYSSWVAYGGNAESASDFGIDSTAPTGGTVYDGTAAGIDAAFNDGSLSSLSANWDGFVATVSGLSRYDYSIGSSAGGTDILTWTSNSTNTSVTATSLTLRTAQMYFFNVRAVDNAGNSAIVSSNGQLVAPSLTFTVSPTTVTFSNLGTTNSFNDTKTTTLTTTTNAYNGYVIKAYETTPLTSSANPIYTIPDFNGGTYAAPDGWLTGDRGFGYNSSDTSIQGANKFNSATCPGGNSGACYAPFSSTAPGDIVADHDTGVTGSPVTDNFTITYQVKTDAIQMTGAYTTVIVYTVTPSY